MLLSNTIRYFKTDMHTSVSAPPTTISLIIINTIIPPSSFTPFLLSSFLHCSRFANTSFNHFCYPLNQCFEKKKKKNKIFKKFFKKFSSHYTAIFFCLFFFFFFLLRQLKEYFKEIVGFVSSNDDASAVNNQ